MTGLPQVPGPGPSGSHDHAGHSEVDCAAVVLRMFEYVDNEAGPEDGVWIREHLDDCRSCLREYDRDVLLKAMVRRACEGDATRAGVRDLGGEVHARSVVLLAQLRDVVVERRRIPPRLQVCTREEADLEVRPERTKERRERPPSFRSHPPPRHDQDVDVAVCGGGPPGVAAAQHDAHHGLLGTGPQPGRPFAEEPLVR